MNNQLTVSLQQAAQLIANCPENRFLLEGEPGIGKSSIIKVLEEMTGYKGYYVDCANLDLGDVTCPMPVKETKTLEYFVNGNFGLQDGKPVIIMLDEFTKASDPVKNTLHPLLEVRNPRLGNMPLPAGSIVFLTGNGSSVGVGDSLKAHTKMRLTVIKVRKPSADEWLPWASLNNISPVIMAWINRNAHALASYMDNDQAGNPYIFQPNLIQDGVVSPRTLEYASNLVKRKEYYDEVALHVSLSGTIGEAASTSLASYIRHNDRLPSWRSIIEHPTTTPVPEEQGALAVLVYGALERVDRETISAWMVYLERLETEWQFIFNIALARNPQKQSVGFTCRKFAEWCSRNSDLL
jgi:MoxR-like ATPase